MTPGARRRAAHGGTLSYPDVRMLATIEMVLVALVVLNLVGMTIAAYVLFRRK